jgi:hypothetical protein
LPGRSSARFRFRCDAGNVKKDDISRESQLLQCVPKPNAFVRSSLHDVIYGRRKKTFELQIEILKFCGKTCHSGSVLFSPELAINPRHHFELRVQQSFKTQAKLINLNHKRPVD